FFQNDYEPMLKIIHIENYNRSYWSSAWAGMIWYNRSQRVINMNFTFIKDSGRNLKLDIQTYKFMKNANEYRFFPITLHLDLCEAFQTNYFDVMEFLRKYSNIPGCYLKKGSYSVHNGVFNMSRLPPHMPNGNYKVKVRLLSKDEFIADLYVISEIVEKKK
ncbi:hypothetical protein ILUMI_16123, partial [Ignelater luminosus]